MVKALWLTLLLLPALVLAETPDILRPVTDTRGLLNRAEQDAVADKLVSLRQDTGVQMAVLVVGSTSGEPIEDYAHRVATTWKGGQKGQDNGLLLVVAVNDRRMRLEVGYGLEEYLPDDATRRLLDAQGPLMREHNYSLALLSIIQGVRESLPTVGEDGTVWQPWSPERVRNTFMWLMWTALAVGLLLGLCSGPWKETLGGARRLIQGGLLCAPPVIAAFIISHGHRSPGLFLLGYGAHLAVFFAGVLCFASMSKRLGIAILVGTVLGSGAAWAAAGTSGDLLGLLYSAATLSLFLTIGLTIFLFVVASPFISGSYGGSYSSGGSTWDSSYSSGSSWDSSSSSSSWDSSSSSSSSDSSWGGGGGDFGGGGSSSSW